MEIAKLIDHTNIKPDMSLVEFEKLVGEYKKYGFRSICVHLNSATHIHMNKFKGRVCFLAGHPLGYNQYYRVTGRISSSLIGIKKSGVEVEIDLVAPLNLLKSGDYLGYREIVEGITYKCHGEGIKVKAIVESPALTEAELITATVLCYQSSVDYIKTGTGLFGRVKKDHVVQIRRAIAFLNKTVGTNLEVKIKASGGISTLGEARIMLANSADILGCSKSVKVVEGR